MTITIPIRQGHDLMHEMCADPKDLDIEDLTAMRKLTVTALNNIVRHLYEKKFRTEEANKCHSELIDAMNELIDDVVNKTITTQDSMEGHDEY